MHYSQNMIWVLAMVLILFKTTCRGLPFHPPTHPSARISISHLCFQSDRRIVTVRRTSQQHVPHDALMTTCRYSIHRDSAYEAFSVLAKRDKSWQRLGHLVDLAMENGDERDIRSITDVGTDHGLLAIGLALSGRFDHVLGVDVSEKALTNGGLRLLEKVRSRAKEDDALQTPLTPEEDSSFAVPVEFRLSNGLSDVRPNEADAVCIAGMGVNTIVHILTSSCKGGKVLDMDRLDCKQLILQPTNSRPRNLMKLYHLLQQSGWYLLDERIEYMSTRWYISSCFTKEDPPDPSQATHLPTSKLAMLDTQHPMRGIVMDYWHHHINWLDRDEKLSRGNLHEADERWRRWVRNAMFEN